MVRAKKEEDDMPKKRTHKTEGFAHKRGVDSHDEAVKDKRHRRRKHHVSKDIHEDRGTVQTRLGRKHHPVRPK